MFREKGLDLPVDRLFGRHLFFESGMRENVPPQTVFLRAA